MKKAVFLDRDGVINVDSGYVSKREDFVFCEGVFDALKSFQKLGYMLIIVTNQSGIGRGYYSEKDFLALSEWMNDELKNKGIKISKVYYCPHAPDAGCECRKPKPKMILDAVKEFDIDLKNSVMVGDKLSDMEAGKKAGVARLFLLSDGKSEFEKAKNLLEVSRKLSF